MLKTLRNFASISSRKEICLLIFLGGPLFQLRLNYAWRGQVTSEPKRGKITEQRRTPHMPATEKKKGTTMGVERVRYMRAKEKSAAARLQRKMGTTECTTAAPIPWIRF